MKVAIETQIFSPGYIFAYISDFTHLMIEGQENYQKRSLRNKYFIQTSHGILPLSIPLQKGKHQQQNIQDVCISYEENWQKHHVQSIRTAYGKSPFFEYYFDDIREVLETRHERLFTFNMAVLKKILSLLKMNMDISVSELYLTSDVDDITVFKPPYQAPALQHPETLPYLQVWSPPGSFTEPLSILDTLFCCGPDTLPILRRWYG